MNSKDLVCVTFGNRNDTATAATVKALTDTGHIRTVVWADPVLYGHIASIAEENNATDAFIVIWSAVAPDYFLEKMVAGSQPKAIFCLPQTGQVFGTAVKIASYTRSEDTTWHILAKCTHEQIATHIAHFMESKEHFLVIAGQSFTFMHLHQELCERR